MNTGLFWQFVIEELLHLACIVLFQPHDTIDLEGFLTISVTLNPYVLF